MFHIFDFIVGWILKLTLLVFYFMQLRALKLNCRFYRYKYFDCLNKSSSFIKIIWQDSFFNKFCPCSDIQGKWDNVGCHGGKLCSFEIACHSRMTNISNRLLLNNPKNNFSLSYRIEIQKYQSKVKRLIQMSKDIRITMDS